MLQKDIVYEYGLKVFFFLIIQLFHIINQLSPLAEHIYVDKIRQIITTTL